MPATSAARLGLAWSNGRSPAALPANQVVAPTYSRYAVPRLDMCVVTRHASIGIRPARIACRHWLDLTRGSWYNCADAATLQWWRVTCTLMARERMNGWGRFWTTNRAASGLGVIL